MLTRFLAALRRFWYPFSAAFTGRGEVADARCPVCAQLDEDEALGIEPLDIAIWNAELTREEQ